MRTTLRIAFVLLSWVLLVTGAWAQPTPKDQSSQVLSPSDGRTTLALPLAVSAGTVTSYTITGPLPNTATQGTLWVNGVQVTSVPRTVALADADNIEFDPVSTFFGTYFFQYTATGTGGTSTAVSYGISVSKNACAQTSRANLFDRATNESWEGPTYPSITVGGTTLTASGFTQAASAGGTTELSVIDDLTMPGKALVWSADYSSASTTANQSSFTITFSRPVSNYSVTVGDLDIGGPGGANWIDVLTVNGFSSAASVTPIALTAANYALGPNNDNTYSGNNVFTGTGENAAASPDLAGANLIITFTEPVQRVTFTYANTTATANPSKQVLTFPAMSWCAQADVTTSITAAAGTVNSGATGQFNVAFSNIGSSDQADGVVGRVQLPAGLNSTTQDVVATNGGVYDNTTGLVTYSSLTSLAAATTGNTSAFSSVITFRMPSTQVSATATISTTSNEGDNVRPNSATASIATGAAAPLAANDVATTPAGTAITFPATGNDTNTGTVSATTIDLDPNTAGGQTSFTVAGVGTFTTSGVAAGSVRFTPVNNTYTGTVTIPYTITNATTGVVSNQANLTVHITPALDLSTSITGPANNSTLAAGSALTYTVTATNGSTFAVSNVTETLQLPAGLAAGGAPTFTVGGVPSLTPTYNNTTGLLTFTPAGGSTLNANSTTTYTVSFPSVRNAGTITATANISTLASNGQETNQANNTAVNTVTVTPSFDVTTSLVGTVNQFNVPVPGTTGNEVTYLVRTNNSAGSGSAAPNVVQTVTFNAVLSEVYASNNGVVTTTATSTTVTFPALASLAAGESVPNTISFLAPAAAYTATATVTANGSTNTGDTNTGNNTASVAATVQAAAYTPTDVYTTIVSNQTLATVGSPVTLTVTSGNNGPATAINVFTQVYLPAGLTGPGLGGTVQVTNGTYNSATGVVTFDGIGLPSAGTNPLAYTVTYNAPATGPVLATATITTDNGDLVPGNNTDQVKVDVAVQADVTTVLEGPVSVVVGQTANYSVVTANNGPTPAASVVQTVQLPVGLSSVTFGGPTTGSYNSATGLATFTLSSPLQAGAREVNTISFTVPANTVTDPSGATSGSNRLSAVARVSTSTLESSYANNTSAVVAAVTPAADVRVTINGPTTAIIGSPVTYTMTTTNNGPGTIAAVTPTMQLPAGLDGVVVAGGTYAPATGLVTFDAVANLRSGGSVANAVVLTMPNVSRLTPVAQAVVGSSTLESAYASNRADVTTAPAAASATRADLNTTISITTGSASPTPNTGMVLTAVFQNADVAGGVTATGVLPSVQLPAGLGTVTVAGAGLPTGSYDNTTGLVTFNNGVGQTFAPSTTQTYTLSFAAPQNGTVTGISSIAATTSDSNPNNNAAATSFTVVPVVDVTTSVSGPTTYAAGGRVVYAVNTVNNGPSPSVISITQTVRVPDTATNLSFPAGSTQSGASGGFITVTFPVIASQAVGSSGTVTNYVSFDAPAAATSYTVTANVSMTGDALGTNNAASVTATMNRAPIAYNVVSNVEPQNYIASTAGPRLISPLDASDADNNTLTYTLTSLPDAGTGVLYLNSAGTTPAAIGVPYSATQIAGLYFDPLGSRTTAGQGPPASYVGNAFFTYTVTDNATVPATSAPAIYTIQIGRDLASTYSNATSRGGSASNYSNGDLVGYLTDLNDLRYTSAGTLYDAAVANGTLFTGADNGIASATADAASLATLSGLGLELGNNGEIRVTNRNLLRGGSFPLTITTVDDNGGTNTQTVSLSIGLGPLPVTLVDFSAKAQRTDAQLNWATAQEKNNDYFALERSLDGVTFEQVGRVAGHGTSTVSHQYSYTDADVARLGRVVYYRLKQVDLDGTSALSEVRTVSFGAAAGQMELTLFPNPTSEQLTVRLGSAAKLVQVYSAAGKLLLQSNPGGLLSTSFDVRTLPAGTYLVQVQAADGQLLTRRFVKY